MKGSTAIEKEVLLVLGIARNGPIAIYIRKVKREEKKTREKLYHLIFLVHFFLLLH